MAEVTLLYEGLPDLVPMTGRSDGVHVSHVIHYLCVKLGHYTESDKGPDRTRMGMGNALEHAIINRFAIDQPDRYVQIGELEEDGIFGTPDLVDIETEGLAVHEIKLTWMSSKHDIHSEKLWKYLVQLKAYCWMMKTTHGRLHVGYVNGDYRYGEPSGQPTYRVWGLEFGRSELAENWKMIRANAEAATEYRNRSAAGRKAAGAGLRKSATGQRRPLRRGLR